jgi:hypothetical protein
MSCWIKLAAVLVALLAPAIGSKAQARPSRQKKYGFYSCLGRCSSADIHDQAVTLFTSSPFSLESADLRNAEARARAAVRKMLARHGFDCASLNLGAIIVGGRTAEIQREIDRRVDNAADHYWTVVKYEYSDRDDMGYNPATTQY